MKISQLVFDAEREAVESIGMSLYNCNISILSYVWNFRCLFSSNKLSKNNNESARLANKTYVPGTPIFPPKPGGKYRQVEGHQNCIIMMIAKLHSVPEDHDWRWRSDSSFLYFFITKNWKKCTDYYNVKAHRELLREKKLRGDDSPETRPELQFEGYIYSPNCIMELKIEAKTMPVNVYASKAIKYALMMIVVSLNFIFWCENWMWCLGERNRSIIDDQTSGAY